MATKRRKLGSIGQILVRLEKITSEQLQEGLEVQKTKFPDKKIGEIFIALGYITQADLTEAVALQFVYPSIEVSRYKIDTQVFNLVPEDFIKKHRLIPLDKFKDIITFAMANPLDEPVIEDIKRITGCKPRVFIAGADDLNKVINLMCK